MGESDRVVIPADDAIKMLKDSEYIHTFINPRPSVMIGVDWEREKLISAIQAAGSADLTGKTAMSLGHGIAIKHDGAWLFIETKMEG